MVLTALIFAGCGGTKAPAAESDPGNVNETKVTSFDPPMAAADFTLSDHKGRDFRLSDQQGNYVLLFFGYTSCPDVCPTSLLALNRAMNALGDDAARVRVGFVTVDPERDTPEKLAAYMQPMGENFLGLTGSAEDLKSIYTQYAVFVERVEVPESAIGYLMSHSAQIYVIDPEGRLSALYPFGITGEEMADDLRHRMAAEAGR